MTVQLTAPVLSAGIRRVETDAMAHVAFVPRDRARLRSYRQISLVLTALLGLGSYWAWFAQHATSGQDLWVVGAIFAAALLSSVAGFAFPAMCGAVLFHIVEDPIRAVQIMMVCGAAGQLLMVWSLRRHIVWRDLSPFLLGAAIGLPIGLYILLNTKPALYLSAIGVFLIVYVLFRVFQAPVVVRNQHVAFDVGVGVLGGITGGAAALPGAFVTIWCGCKGWPKERQRGIYQPFILCVQLAAITGMVLLGPSARRPVAFDLSGVAYVPAMILGVAIGMSFFKRMSDRQFTMAVNLLLIASGLSFVL